MKKRLLTFALVAALALGLSACGGAPGNESSEVETLKAQIADLQAQLAEAQKGSSSSSAVIAAIDETTAEQWGVCGPDLMWYYQNGILVIRGTGDMTDFLSLFTVIRPWEDFVKEIQWVYIEDGVTSIGEYAFQDCRYLSKVEIPNSVTMIRSHAFENCVSLTEVAIPGSVDTIESFAFANCDGLQNLTIAEGVTTIEEKAFDSCDVLPSITLPESLTTLGDDAFWNCRELKEVVILNKNLNFSDSEFYYNNSDVQIVMGG